MSLDFTDSIKCRYPDTVEELLKSTYVDDVQSGISNIVGKANRTLRFIQRNLGGCMEDIKSRAYTTLVRPHLEYGSCVWDPHTQKHISDIEGVQRRAARFVKSCHKREPGTVTQLLKDLNWCSLEHRRKVARLTYMHKIVNGEIAINIPAHVQKQRRVTRQYHPKRFINIGSTSNTYKYSFFTRTIKEWNTLPVNVIEQSTTNSFKAALSAHYSNTR